MSNCRISGTYIYMHTFKHKAMSLQYVVLCRNNSS